MASEPRKPRGKQSPIFPLSRVAGQFLLAGQVLMVLSLCHFAALLWGEGRTEALLYIEAYAGSLASSLILLWGVTLWLDRLERKRAER